MKGGTRYKTKRIVSAVRSISKGYSTGMKEKGGLKKKGSALRKKVADTHRAIRSRYGMHGLKGQK